MTRTLLAALVTLGDPETLSGGYLYHRRLADLAATHHARLQFVSVRAGALPVSLLGGARVVASIGRGPADVVVLDSIAAAFVGPWLALRHPRLPMVGMLHQPPGGIDHGPVRTRVQAYFDRLAYRYVQRLLVASESLAEDLRRGGQDPDRICVVPPGRDVAQTAEAGPPPGDVRRGRRIALLCVGNWVERKGILSLLDAFAPLEASVATLHLVGDPRTDPSYAARVRERLARPDLTHRVVVHGAVSVGAVAALYAATDAFVLPSLKEPYGTVYGEAMAYGLPVVGWQAGNLPYLAEHEREGLLVDPGDTRGLTEALQRLADDPSLRARLGASARRRALERPTWDQVAGLFFGHLRQISGR